MPTLETVNHRLNIFKKKIERVDYLEILSKETATKDKKGAGGGAADDSKKKNTSNMEDDGNKAS